jgi:hypothetical protein
MIRRYKGAVEMQYEILIVVGIVIIVVLLLLWTVDKEVKYLNELGIKRSTFISIKKCKILFPFHKRNENLISKFVFVNMLIFLIINVSGGVLLLFHLMLEHDLLFILSVCVLFLNLAVFVSIGIKISLNQEQRKIKTEDQKRRRIN